jgi:hypothetical protein
MGGLGFSNRLHVSQVSMAAEREFVLDQVIG